MKLGFAPYLPLPVSVAADGLAETERILGRALDQEERDRVQKTLNLSAVSYSIHNNSVTWIEVQRALFEFAHAPHMFQPRIKPTLDWVVGHITINSDPALYFASNLITEALKEKGIGPHDAKGEQIREVALVLRKQKSPFTRRGRSRDAIPRIIILILADLFEALGGTASASFKPIKGRRDSPFLCWLRAVGKYLEPATRLRFLSGLDERAKAVLKERKTLAARQSFKSLDLSAFAWHTASAQDEALLLKLVDERVKLVPRGGHHPGT